MKLSDFDFDLPNSLIAQYPREKRTDSRLLVVQDDFINATFSQLDEFCLPVCPGYAYVCDVTDGLIV